MIPSKKIAHAPHQEMPRAGGFAHPAQRQFLTGQMQPKKVVVVDDSRSARSWLRHVIATDPRLKVVGEASDAQEARSIIKATNPDVLTLDIDMPGMSGLEFLARLIALRPMPVVMVSSLTDRGSDAAIHALALGAVDCIVKPSTVMDESGHRDLTRRLYAAACSRVSGPSAAPIRIDPAPQRTSRKSRNIVLIGASTGGVAALETVLGGLDPAGPPVVIAQHMPAPFLESFAHRLNKLFPQDVGLLRADTPLCHGQVCLAPGGGVHGIVQLGSAGWLSGEALRASDDSYCPSVDQLFRSAVPMAPFVTAALLTGLGQDGAMGLKALRNAGAHTIGQDSTSCVVYGMPRAAFEAGAVWEQLALGDIAQAINRACAARNQQPGGPS